MQSKSNKQRTQFWRRNYVSSKKHFRRTNIYLNCLQNKDLSSTSANSAPSFSFQKSICRSTMVGLIQRTTFTATTRVRLISRDTPIPTSSTLSHTPTKTLAAKLPPVIWNTKSSKMKNCSPKYAQSSPISSVKTFRRLTERSVTFAPSKPWWVRWSRVKLTSKGSWQRVFRNLLKCSKKWNTNGRLSWLISKRQWENSSIKLSQVLY